MNLAKTKKPKNLKPQNQTLIHYNMLILCLEIGFVSQHQILPWVLNADSTGVVHMSPEKELLYLWLWVRTGLPAWVGPGKANFETPSLVWAFLVIIA